LESVDQQALSAIYHHIIGMLPAAALCWWNVLHDRYYL